MDLFYSDESKNPYMLLFAQRRRLRYEIHFSQVMLLISGFSPLEPINRPLKTECYNATT